MMEIEDNSEKQKKLYFMTEQLNEFHSKLNSYEIQSRIPLENLSLMGNCSMSRRPCIGFNIQLSFQQTSS